MRVALRKDAQTMPVSVPISIPAPTGGWNARDGLANMPIIDAEIMTNWFPETTDVRTRRGSATYGSALPNQVETIFAYSGGASLKLLCAAGNAVINITTVGTLTTVSQGQTIATGFANDRWQYINIGTPGGQYLIAVNGEDPRQIFDGEDWYAGSVSTGSALTVAPSNVCLYNRRVFYTEAGTLRFLYHQQVNAIGGTVSPFDLSAQFDMGGYLVGIDTWTRDGGSGMDDAIVFITSNGQAAVYTGIDPGDATAWTRLGIYRLAAPLSYRSTTKLNGDLLIATEAGIIPLSAVVSGAMQQASYVSDKIRKAVNEAVRQYRNNWGWELCYYPQGHMLFLNVPVADGASQEQFVMNTNTGSWCRFTGWQSNTFAVFKNDLYFGSNTVVLMGDTGTNDNGSDVQNDVKQAASVFGYPGRIKHFKMFRPQIASDGDLPISIGIVTDFSKNVPQNVPSPTPIPLAEWDVATWDDFNWADEPIAVPRWLSGPGIGTWAQVRMSGAVNVETIQWYGTDIIFEPGEFV